MKKLLIISAILLSLTTTLASARTENFIGPAASLGLGLVATSSSYQYRGTDNNSDHYLGQNRLFGVINLSYLSALNEKWLIGGGASYDLNPSGTGESSYRDSSSNYTNTTKMEQHFSVYLQPTYTLNETTALFGKVSYHSIKIKLRDDNGQLYPITPYSKTLNGLGAGVGVINFIKNSGASSRVLEQVTKTGIIA